MMTFFDAKENNLSPLKVSSSQTTSAPESLTNQTTNQGCQVGFVKRESFKRWYDHDPVLMRLMRVLYQYEVEVSPYVRLFLNKVEAQVGSEVLQAFYEEVEQQTPRGRRWYDEDPYMFKLIELFRLMPSDVQRRSADTFLGILKQYGVDLSHLIA
jgi:hypothetical protein